MAIIVPVQSLHEFAYSPAFLVDALHCSLNSNSCPGSISFKLLKAVAKSIIRQLNIIFQHSLFEGTFPPVWKAVVVIPLYKEKGATSSPENYRPIRLCQYLGKTLERMVHTQISSYISDNELLSNRQHGFTPDRSAFTNLLTCDALIADVMILGHLYDILLFSFIKAFNKTPHNSVLSAMANIGISDKAPEWLASFLANCTLSVRVDGCLSASSNVISGVIQGLSSGPILYAIFIDNLLRKINLPSQGYADDLKYVANISVHSKEIVQNEISTLS